MSEPPVERDAVKSYSSSVRVRPQFYGELVAIPRKQGQKNKAEGLRANLARSGIPQTSLRRWPTAYARLESRSKTESAKSTRRFPEKKGEKTRGEDCGPIWPAMVSPGRALGSETAGEDGTLRITDCRFNLSPHRTYPNLPESTYRWPRLGKFMRLRFLT